MTNKTIFGLTDVGVVDKHGATELVKFLLQAVGRDIVSIQRNTHVSYMAVERARDIIKVIDTCIDTMESDAGDWPDYLKFAESIDPLETLLFDLLDFADDQEGQSSDKLTEVPVGGWRSLVDRWADKRAKISNILNDPGLTHFPVTQSSEEAQLHDDKTLLDELWTGIKGTLTEDPPKFPSYVLDIKSTLDALQDAVIQGSSQNPEGWRRVLTIKTSILISGVLDLGNNVALEIQNNLKSNKVWEAAKALIKVLTPNTEDPKTEDDANVEFNKFIAALEDTIDIELPGNYVELMKKVGHIRRPFLAQAITVVGLCRVLANKFGQNKSTVTIENRNSLEGSFNKTLATLDRAAEAAIDLKNFDLENFETHGTVQAFKDALAPIRESFLSLSLGTEAEWTAEADKLTTAATNDKNRMQSFKDKLQVDGGGLKRSVEAPVTVNVTIYEHENDTDELETSQSVEGEPTTRLSALRWTVAGVLQQEGMKRKARTTGTFYKKGSDDQWSKIPPTQSTLKEVLNGQTKVDLKLVVS